MSAEAASTASTAKGYVRELRALELPQLQPLRALKANNKLLVIPYALSCVKTRTHTHTHTHPVHALTHPHTKKHTNKNINIAYMYMQRVSVECTSQMHNSTAPHTSFFLLLTHKNRPRKEKSLKAVTLWRSHHCVTGEMQPGWDDGSRSPRPPIAWWLVQSCRGIEGQWLTDYPRVHIRVLCYGCYDTVRIWSCLTRRLILKNPIAFQCMTTNARCRLACTHLSTTSSK